MQIARTCKNVTLASHAKNQKNLEFPTIEIGTDFQQKLIDFDLVIFDRFIMEEYYGWMVREALPEALQILDMQDVHFLRRARQETPSIDPKTIRSDTLLRELGSIYRVDGTLVISSYEYALLQDFGIPQNLLCHYPMYAEKMQSVPAFDARAGFSFLGNFRHAPNLDAALYLLSIWPRVLEKIPHATLHLFGAYPVKSISDKVRSAKGVKLHAHVPDAKESLASTLVQIVPLRFGAGIKGKILSSWMAGTPVVTSSIGAEGMHDGEHFGGSIVDDEAIFIEEALRLATHESAWKKAQNQGALLLETLFNRALLEEKLMQFIETRRMEEQNLIGSILRHDTCARTRYFSKWLALKKEFLA